jgi:hypothetical protein
MNEYNVQKTLIVQIYRIILHKGEHKDLREKKCQTYGIAILVSESYQNYQK